VLWLWREYMDGGGQILL